MINKISILMPLYGHTEFANLALRSIQKYSSFSMSLILVVEPVNTDADEVWLNKIQEWWPWELIILRNKKRMGYYASVNIAVRNCKTEKAILFTSDQVASPGWDVDLLDVLRPGYFVTGRLVESGVNLIADRNIWKNFGTDPSNFNEQGFIDFCTQFTPRKQTGVPHHYIPMAFYVKDFIEAGFFVEGYDSDKVSTYREDLYFFLRVIDKGYKLLEVQRPLTYHFQSGSRQDRFHWGWLNWLYPFGLKYIHRYLTGYIATHDALLKKIKEKNK